MQSVQGGEGNGRTHSTTSSSVANYRSKYEIAPRSLRGGWVARIRPCTYHTQNRRLDVELRTPVRYTISYQVVILQKLRNMIGVGTIRTIVRYKILNSLFFCG